MHSDRRTILITGGAGNVGGALARRLTTDPANRVVILDNLSTGSKSKLPDDQSGDWLFVDADANNYQDISEVMFTHRFDYAFHYAAVVGVQRTQADPISVLDDIQGIRNFLKLSKNTGVKKVFFASSSEVYGEPVTLPQHEDTTPLNSRVPYAIVKNVGEAYFRSFHKHYGLPYTIFRFFNTYGPRQSTDFVVPRFLAAALKGEDIPIYGTGAQSRTFCYVDDNVETCASILDQGLANNEVVNIGSDTETTVAELARLVIEITDSSSQLRFLPPLEEGDMTRRQPDNAKMRDILKRDLVSLEDGIRMMMNHPAFLASIGL